jgi:DNA-binding MarR family transcriptional regulator
MTARTDKQTRAGAKKASGATDIDVQAARQAAQLQTVTEGARQYADLLDSADPLAIEIILGLWQASHTQMVANGRAIDALNLSVSVSGARLTVLRTLFFAPEKAMSLSEISRTTGISPTMVTNLVDGLAKGGLVRRAGSLVDRRVSIAHLTRDGEKTFHKVLPVMSARMTQACDQFTKEEKQLLLGLLQRLLKTPPPGDS